MEKIYMNEEKSKRQRNSSLNTSVILSLVVAVFAIAALITVGFNQISFAAPLDPNAGQFRSASHADRIYRKDYDELTEYNVPIYYDDTGNVQVFCIEHSREYAGDSIYLRNKEITDYGLLYLLAHTLVSGEYVTPDSLYDNINTAEISKADAKKYVETWIAQSAIWVYQNNVGAPNSELSSTEIGIVENTDNLVAHVNNSEDIELNLNLPSGKKLYNYIKDLVDAAGSHRNAEGFVFVSTPDHNLSKVDGGKYYQTSAITVTADSTNEMKHYRVSTSGVDGAFVVGEDGNTISEDQDLQPGTKIFVRVPSDKVKDVSKNLALNVDATFSIYAGYIYSVDEDSQDVVTVEDQEAHILGGTVFELIGTPDTGMNTAQTIYFIGLVVLLCGVGIIYANAKPVKKQSQQ